MAPTPMQENLPLGHFASWQPFRLDALGLVTLLGADEVANALGALHHNVLTDYLPVFGSFKVASGQIARVNPGFALYNITDGIWVTELAPWFTRWLSANLDDNYTVLKWDVESKARRRPKESYLAMLIGLLVNSGLVVLACVQADWYGIANAVAMTVSVAVKMAICHRYRKAINAQAEKFNGQRDNGPNEEAIMRRQKLLIVLPDGKLAIGYLPVGVVPMMLDRKPPALLWKRLWAQAVLRAGLMLSKTSKGQSQKTEVQPYWFQVTLWLLRASAWIGFGIQIVAIGQATLLSQLCTVAVMTLASVATIYNIGVLREDQIGRYLTIGQTSANASSRQATYAMLEPTGDQEDYMRARGLLPDQRNTEWYKKWKQTKIDWADHVKQTPKARVVEEVAQKPGNQASSGGKVTPQSIGSPASPQAGGGTQQP